MSRVVINTESKINCPEVLKSIGLILLVLNPANQFPVITVQTGGKIIGKKTKKSVFRQSKCERRRGCTAHRILCDSGRSNELSSKHQRSYVTVIHLRQVKLDTKKKNPKCLKRSNCQKSLIDLFWVKLRAFQQLTVKGIKQNLFSPFLDNIPIHLPNPEVLGKQYSLIKIRVNYFSSKFQNKIVKNSKENHG